MLRVLLSGELRFDSDILYAKKDGSIYAYGELVTEHLNLTASLKSRQYAMVEEAEEQAFLCEGYLFQSLNEDKGEELLFAVQETYPYQGPEINRCIANGTVVNLKRTKNGYIFELRTTMFGQEIFLNVFCDSSKLSAEHIEDKDEVLIIGRLRETGNTGEVVLFADAIEVLSRSYEFEISFGQHEEVTVETDEE